MRMVAKVSSPTSSRSALRTIPDKDLDSSEQISMFLRREIADLQDSGDESKEVRIGIATREAGRATIGERVITLKVDGDKSRITVEGLVKNPITLPVRRSLVGPTQLLYDEISGTYQQDSF